MLRDAEKTIGNLADKQKTAFISSVDPEGYPALRAMLAPRRRVGIHTFYFTTNASSRHVAQYLANPKAGVYFCDRRFFRGVQLYGTMEVLTDPESKESIWQAGDTLYYPGGVTDPDYCVLRFTAERGRYYSNFKSEDFEIGRARRP